MKFVAIYCRQIVVIKITLYDFKYDYDLNFESDFCNFIQKILIYFVRIREFVNEKLLNIKQILFDFYTKKFKNVLNIEMFDYKNMNTYVRVKKFELFREMKILFSKVIFKIKRNLND